MHKHTHIKTRIHAYKRADQWKTSSKLTEMLVQLRNRLEGGRVVSSEGRVWSWAAGISIPSEREAMSIPSEHVEMSIPMCGDEHTE